ncbi:TPA: hypothetical protein DD712_03190 [Candidatus Acetothermia bacterium]|nr:hypothetical protein [Candidatus Acetothermia bacterium]
MGNEQKSSKAQKSKPITHAMNPITTDLRIDHREHREDKKLIIFVNSVVDIFRKSFQIKPMNYVIDACLGQEQ